MQSRFSTLLTMGLLVAVPVLAKGKAERIFPVYILHARTYTVVIDPAAGIDIKDPQANQIAQRDVEKALLTWGRFQPVMSSEGADLIIVVRRGHEKLVDTTISDPRQNDRMGSITPTDNGLGIGAQHGTPTNPGGSQSTTGQMPPQAQIPHPQTEIGGTEDSFLVFDGTVSKPLDSAPGWRYTAQDGLRPHNVPAVEAFKKAVAAGEKAAAAAQKP